jgi:hypothetical protein
MKITTEKEYDDAMVFLDAFFEEPEMYTKEDAEKVKQLLKAVSEYEEGLKNQNGKGK